MGKRSTGPDELKRLAASVGRSLHGTGGGYSLSTLMSDPLRRKLRGRWLVVEHTVDGEAYAERFAARALKGSPILDPVYSAEYEFKDGLCLKRVEVGGWLEGAEGRLDYAFRLRVGLSWDFDAPGLLSILPEFGYQCTELGGEAGVVKDLERGADPILVSFRFEADTLVLEEGEDVKRLVRAEPHGR